MAQLRVVSTFSALVALSVLAAVPASARDLNRDHDRAAWIQVDADRHLAEDHDFDAANHDFDGADSDSTLNGDFVPDHDLAGPVGPDSDEDLRYGGGDSQDFATSLSNYSLGSGGRFCTATFYASQYVDAFGTANPGARFMVMGASTPNGTFSTLYQSADNTPSSHTTYNPYTYPGSFPGYFKMCVRNTGSSSIKFSLSFSGY